MKCRKDIESVIKATFKCISRIIGIRMHESSGCSNRATLIPVIVHRWLARLCRLSLRSSLSADGQLSARDRIRSPARTWTVWPASLLVAMTDAELIDESRSSCTQRRQDVTRGQDVDERNSSPDCAVTDQTRFISSAEERLRVPLMTN